MAILPDKQIEMLRLYEEGCSDREIGAAVGKTRESIKYWRRSRGFSTKQGNFPTLTPEDSDRRLALHQAGLSDRAIAREVGVTERAIRDWRARHSLGPHFGREYFVDQESARKVLYVLGLTDAAIGSLQNRAASSIARWRKARNLPAKSRKSNFGANPSQECRRLALYCARCTDAQIADALDMRVRAVSSWRRRRGLISHYRRSTSAEEESVRRQLYLEGYSDTEIAAKLGRSQPGISKWRNKHALPPNPTPKRDPTYKHRPGRLRSLDAEVFEGGADLHSYVKDERVADWLEEMGATVW